jgi:hypothetical protein
MSQPADGISLEDFKRIACEFSKESESLSERDLEAGYTAVTKGYLGIPGDQLTLLLAKGYLEHATRCYMKRQNVLEYGYDPMERLKAMVGL